MPDRTTGSDVTAARSAPRLRAGRPLCPRCDARLLFDGEDLVCLACGYAYAPAKGEHAEYMGRGPRAA